MKDTPTAAPMRDHATQAWEDAWDALPDAMHAYTRARQAGINALVLAHAARPAAVNGSGRLQAVWDAQRDLPPIEFTPAEEAAIYAAFQASSEAGPLSDQVRPMLEEARASDGAGHVLAAAAQLIHDYYTREIERLMHQAQHWHDEGRHPAAVHHRVTKADAYYQIVAFFDPAKLALGWKDPFEQMSEALARPRIKDQGTYPPSAELHAYRDPRFTAQKLAEVAAMPPAKTSRFDPPGLWESEPRSSADISGQVIR